MFQRSFFVTAANFCYKALLAAKPSFVFVNGFVSTRRLPFLLQHVPTLLCCKKRFLWLAGSIRRYGWLAGWIRRYGWLAESAAAVAGWLAGRLTNCAAGYLAGWIRRCGWLWLAGWLIPPLWLADWLIPPLWLAGWLAESAAMAHWLTGWIRRYGSLAGWLNPPLWLAGWLKSKYRTVMLHQCNGQPDFIRISKIRKKSHLRGKRCCSRTPVVELHARFLSQSNHRHFESVSGLLENKWCL